MDISKFRNEKTSKRQCRSTRKYCINTERKEHAKDQKKESSPKTNSLEEGM